MIYDLIKHIHQELLAIESPPYPHVAVELFAGAWLAEATMLAEITDTPSPVSAILHRLGDVIHRERKRASIGPQEPVDAINDALDNYAESFATVDGDDSVGWLDLAEIVLEVLR